MNIPIIGVLFCCAILVSGVACKHSVSAAQPESFALPANQAGAQEIKVGMPISNVIKTHGRHYRLFSGPDLTPAHEDDLVYDDISIAVRYAPLYGFKSAVVVSVTATTPDIIRFVEHVQYEDLK